MAAQHFLLTESRGLDRQAEPVSVTASFYPEELSGPGDLRLTDDQGKPVVFQVTDLSDAPSTGGRTRPSRHCRVHFFADLPAHGRRRYRLETLAGAPASVSGVQAAPPAASELVVLGQGLSLRVENEHLAVTLDPTSGQIFTMTNKKAGVTLDSPRTVHWNPDYYDPNRGWPHPFDWSPPPKIAYERGPVFFELFRSGTLKEFPEILLHIRYRMYGSAPYLWVGTLVEILEDVPLVCLRNDEMVFRDVHFSHLAWQESSGRVVSRPLAELRPINKHGDLAKVSPETPWLCFAHCAQGHGVASLRLKAANFNRLGRPLRLRDHSSYFVRSESLQALYWVRPLLYWPYHTPRDQLLVATAGSLYAEENAYGVAAVAPSESAAETAPRLYGQFTEMHARLAHPIYAEVEDELTETIRS